MPFFTLTNPNKRFELIRIIKNYNLNLKVKKCSLLKTFFGYCKDKPFMSAAINKWHPRLQKPFKHSVKRKQVSQENINYLYVQKFYHIVEISVATNFERKVTLVLF